MHVERSVRGGAHITARRTAELTIKENIQLFNQRMPQFKFDYSCTDTSRCCFLVPNEYVVYETEDYYSNQPLSPMPLSEADRQLLSDFKAEEERIFNEKVADNRKGAKPFYPSADDVETLTELIHTAIRRGIDITYDYNVWYRIGFAISNLMGMAGLPLFLMVSSLYPRYDVREATAKYENLCSTSKDKVHLGSIIQFMRNYGVIE